MQTEELSYAIITPYSMRKSRTGGIVGRLISRTGLDLVGGRMFAPSPELAKRYSETIVTETDSRHRATQELLVTTLQDRSRLSYVRYRGGVDTLLNALDADRDLFDAELGLAQTRRNELLTLVQLYRALGGGWQE